MVNVCSPRYSPASDQLPNLLIFVSLNILEKTRPRGNSIQLSLHEKFVFCNLHNGMSLFVMVIISPNQVLGLHFVALISLSVKNL